jgi:cation diffusion facilitator family transporter
MTDRLRSESSAVRAVYAALLGNGLIAVFKFVAAWQTGSSAMLAEGLHSLADTGNQVLLLLGLRLSQRPPDVRHPFGYGKDRFFWAFVVAMSMFTVGAAFSIREGIERLFHPQPLENLIWNYAALGFAVVFETFALRIAFREFRGLVKNQSLWSAVRNVKDPALLTVLFEDTAALVGIILAAGGITAAALTGNYIFDGLASVLIGVVLAAVAFVLAVESRDMLLGESATERDKERMMEAIKGVPEVEKVIELLTMHIAPDDILVNLSVNFRDDLTTDQLEMAIDRIEREVRKAVPEVNRIFIEAETPSGELAKTRKRERSRV